MPSWTEVAWLVVLQYSAVMLAGAALVLRALRKRGPTPTTAQRAFVMIATTVTYASIVDNVLDFGDNNRYRFETDPLVCVASVALMSYALMRIWDTTRPRSSTQSLPRTA